MYLVETFNMRKQKLSHAYPGLIPLHSLSNSRLYSSAIWKSQQIKHRSSGWCIMWQKQTTAGTTITTKTNKDDDDQDGNSNRNKNNNITKLISQRYLN